MKIIYATVAFMIKYRAVLCNAGIPATTTASTINWKSQSISSPFYFFLLDNLVNFLSYKINIDLF